MKLIKNKKNGFTLTETLMSLAIAAIIIISVFLIYPKVRNHSIILTETSHISQIYTAVKSLYSSTSTYSGLGTTPIISPAQIFPDDMLSHNDNLKWGINKWGGYVVVDANNVSPSNVSNSSFTIQYTDVPNDLCADLVNANQSVFYNIYVSPNVTGVPASKNQGNLVKNAGVYSLTDTVKACNQGTKASVSFLAL